MITYTLDIRHNKTPQWWQDFIEYAIEAAFEHNIDLRYGLLSDNPREFIEYVNTVLEQCYDAYYDEGIFGKPHMLEFSTDEGRMLFMLEWS